MSLKKCQKTLKHARNAPNNLRFEDLCRLAECYGFTLHRQSGTSHQIYERKGHVGFLNFQPDKNGNAKPYQVRQLLNLVEMLELTFELEGDEDSDEE